MAVPMPSPLVGQPANRRRRPAGGRRRNRAAAGRPRECPADRLLQRFARAKIGRHHRILRDELLHQLAQIVLALGNQGAAHTVAHVGLSVGQREEIKIRHRQARRQVDVDQVVGISRSGPSSTAGRCPRNGRVRCAARRCRAHHRVVAVGADDERRTDFHFFAGQRTGLTRQPFSTRSTFSTGRPCRKSA